MHKIPELVAMPSSPYGIADGSGIFLQYYNNAFNIPKIKQAESVDNSLLVLFTETLFYSTMRFMVL